MIIGMLTLGSIAAMLLVNGVKVWNLYNKGSKYSWIWTVILFGVVLLAYATLFNNLMLTLHATSIDTSYTTDYWEASNYFLFGQVMVLLSLVLTLGEVMIYLGLLFPFSGMGDPEEDRQKKGMFSFLQR